jgi:hypothetical protein
MQFVRESAAIQDRDGAGLVLDKIRRRFPWLELIWAEGGYNARQVEAAVARVPRRLAKDFENLRETLGAFVALASIQFALRRLARS